MLTWDDLVWSMNDAYHGIMPAGALLEEQKFLEGLRSGDTRLAVKTEPQDRPNTKSPQDQPTTKSPKDQPTATRVDEQGRYVYHLCNRSYKNSDHLSRHLKTHNIRVLTSADNAAKASIDRT